MREGRERTFASFNEEIFYLSIYIFEICANAVQVQYSTSFSFEYHSDSAIVDFLIRKQWEFFSYLLWQGSGFGGRGERVVAKALVLLMPH